MNRTNRHILNKVVSVVLLFAAALSFASCGAEGSGGKTKKISADSAWYDAEIIDFKPELDTRKHVTAIEHDIAGSDDKYIAVYSTGAYFVSDGDNVSYKDWLISVVTLIDRTTKQTVKTLDLVNVLGEHIMPEGVEYADGKIWVLADTYDPDTCTSMNREYEIDPSTGKTTGRDFSTSGVGRIGYAGAYSYNIGKYRIVPETKITNDGLSYCILNVFLPDGTKEEIDIKDPADDIFEWGNIMAVNETTALIPVGTSREWKFFKLDLNSFKLSQAGKEEYSWVDIEKIGSIFNDPKGNSYLTTETGIQKLDFKNNKYEQILDFSWCAINRYYTSRLKIADCNDDKILLGGSYESVNSFQPPFIFDFVIIELTKASRNPYAGRTVIDLYLPDGRMNAIVSDAVIRFNENSKKYYIHITDRYCDRYYPPAEYIESDEEYVVSRTKEDADFSYELATDIANCDGPDILMNTSALGQLNNEDYLIDLSPYFSELNSDKYFKNIIDGAKTDGKLYQLPVCYTIKGIQTSPALAGKSGTGFTPGEYKDFVYDTLNGRDVIELTQTPYFALLFNNMSDRFIKDGKADLTGPEFAELAQYVKDNVMPGKRPKSEDDEEGPSALSDPAVILKSNKALYCNCPGITGYLVKRARLKEATTITGIPSTDGRGPMFGTNVSVAVSANAVNKEACIEFIKMLLTDEIQTEFVINDRFVLNREALRQGFSKAIEYFNTKEGQSNIFDYTEGTNVTINTKFTTEDIDNLENVILSCRKADSADAAINMILIEEMPAYFAGQKTLDQVIPVMQNRIQKVLDERK